MRPFYSDEFNSPTSSYDNWASNQLLSPEYILPEEYFENIRTSVSDRPEARLLFAVFEDCLRTIAKYLPVSVRPKHKRSEKFNIEELVQDCIDWINSDSHEWITDFINICDVLDINPEIWRKKIAKIVSSFESGDYKFTTGCRTQRIRNAGAGHSVIQKDRIYRNEKRIRK